MMAATEDSIANVSVYVRLRPLNKLETDQDSRHVVKKLLDNKLSIEDPSAQQGGDWEVSCDEVLEEGCSQQQVYQKTCQHLPQQLWEGFNCSVIAYGATATGKTHTLLGASAFSSSDTNTNAADDDDTGTLGTSHGLLPQLVQDVFQKLEESEPGLEFTVRCSVVEIYLNQIRDLLFEPNHHRARLDNKGKLVQCAAVSCLSASDVVQTVQKGHFAQTRSALDPNRASARSTFVVQLVLEQYDHRSQDSRESRLLVVDLAASELAALESGESKSMDPDLVLNTLEPLRQYVQEKASRQQHDRVTTSEPPVSKDGPLLSQLLSNSFGGSAYTSLILTVSPSELSAAESVNTLTFGLNCQKLVNRPVALVHHRWQDCHEQMHELKEKQGRLEDLTISLAHECHRLRFKAGSKASDLSLWQVINDLQKHPVGRRIEFTIQTKEEHETRMEMMKIRSSLRRTEKERDEAVSNLTHVQNDLDQAVARANRLQTMLQEKQEELNKISRDDSGEILTLKQRNQELEHNLRTSLFRESEAVVFLRQFRRFYFRLLKQNAAQGTGDVHSVIKGIPGAPDLSQLVDLDRLMIHSGLLEDGEAGVDASFTSSRPSHAALVRSTALADQVASQVSENDRGELNIKDAVSAGEPRALLSVIKRFETGETTEARQRLYQTPSGRYIDMREQALEKDLAEMSTNCIQLENQLRVEKEKTLALQSSFVGVNQGRAAEENRLLKELLQRKDKDLKAVIWKMNELHLAGKVVQEKLEDREPHLSYLEESLTKAERSNSELVADRVVSEDGLREEIATLRQKLDSAARPLPLKTASNFPKPPLETRLVVPFSLGAQDFNSERRTSLGEADKWIDRYDSIVRAEVADAGTQTDPKQLSNAETQTDNEAEIQANNDLRALAERVIQRKASHLSPDDFLFMSDGDDPLSGSYGGLLDAYAHTADDEPEGIRTLEPSPPTDQAKSSVTYTLEPSPPTDPAKPSVTHTFEPSPLVEHAMPSDNNTSSSISIDNTQSTKSTPDLSTKSVSHNLPPKPNGSVDLHATVHMNSTSSSQQNQAPPSFMNKIRNQTPKVEADADGTPEFMRVFKKIGGRNFAESVIVTQGSAAARGPTRTSVPAGLRNDNVVDTSTQYSSTTTKWTPRKKKGSDSDSDDDSFARQFISSSMHAPPANENDDADSDSDDDSDSDTEQNKDGAKSAASVSLENLMEQDEDKKAEEDKKPEHSPWSDSDSTISEKTSPFSKKPPVSIMRMEAIEGDSDSSESSKVKPAVASKAKDNLDSDDSSDDESAPKKPVAAVKPSIPQAKPRDAAGPPKPPFPAAKPAVLQSKRKDDSDSDDSSDEEVGPPKPPVPAAKPKTKDDSDSDDSSDDESAPRKPVAVMKPSAQPPVPAAKPPAAAIDVSSVKDASLPKPPLPAAKPAAPKPKDDSESDDSSVEDSSPPKPPVPVAEPTAPKPKPKDDSDSEDSGDEVPSPKKPVAAAKPATPKPKDDSESDDSGDDEPPPKIPVAASKPAAPQSKDDSESDGSGDDEPPPKKPVAAAQPAASQAKSQVDSDHEESSDEEDEASPPKKPVAPVKPAEPESEQSTEDEEEETSDEEAEASPSQKPVPAAKPADPESEHTSDEEEESSEEEVEVEASPPKKLIPKNPVPTAKPDPESDHSDEEEDDEEDDSGEEGSSDEESEAEEIPPKKPTPAKKPIPLRKPVAPAKPVEPESEHSSDEEDDDEEKGTEEEELSDEESEEESEEEEPAPPKPAVPKGRPVVPKGKPSVRKGKSAAPKGKPAVTKGKAKPDSDHSIVSEESSEDERVKKLARDDTSVATNATKPTANTSSKPHGLGGPSGQSENIMDRIKSKFGQQLQQKANEGQSIDASDPFASVRENRCVEPGLKDAFGADPFANTSSNAGPKRSVPDFASQVTPSLTQAANKLGSEKLPKKKEKAKFVIRDGKLVKADDAASTSSAPKKEKATTTTTTTSAAAKPKTTPTPAPKTKFVIRGGKLVKDDSSINTSLALLARAAPNKSARRNSLDSKTGDVLESEQREERRAALTKKEKSMSSLGSSGSNNKKKGKDDTNNDGSFFVIREGKLVKSPGRASSKAEAKPAFSIVNGKLVKNDLGNVSPKLSKAESKKEKGKKDKKEKKKDKKKKK